MSIFTCEKLSKILCGVRKAGFKACNLPPFPITCPVPVSLFRVPKFDHVFSTGLSPIHCIGWLGLMSVATGDGQKPVESGLQEGKE